MSEPLPELPHKVTKALDGGKDVSVEYIRDAAAEQLADKYNAARDAKATPVHAEDLVAISKKQAAEYVKFDGQSLPRAPSTRRVIPEPFRRESISISPSPGERKQWTRVRAEDIEPGDIVPDVGVVVSKATRIRRGEVFGVDVAMAAEVVLNGPEKQLVVEATTELRAFRVPAVPA